MTDDRDDEPEPEPLTERRRRFVDAYMGEAKGNGTLAARLAGFSGDDASLAVTASRLIRNAKVRAAIDARLECDELVAGRIERVRWLSSVMRGDIQADNLRERLSAQEALSKLAGEVVNKVAQTNAAGEDVKSLTIAELIAMAGFAKGGE